MKIIKHLFALLLALGFLALVLFALFEADKYVQAEKEKNGIKPTVALSPVTVIETAPASSRALMQFFGEVKPRWKTSIKSRMRGEILSISKNVEVGKRVKKGELLFSFDNYHYQTQIAEAQNQIAQADLLIYEHKQQAKLARIDWKLTRRKGNPSAFALRIPQIKAAQAQLLLAKTNLNEIKRSAAYAKIVAPYNGIVLSRAVNLGDRVESGQTLAEMISADELEITLNLDQQQWRLLGKKWHGKQVMVSAVNDKLAVWKGVIDRGAAVIDSKTRQRNLIVKISSAKKPLSGSFVQVDIVGKVISGLLEIPQSALTPKGFIWFVDDKNLLRRFRANIQFSKNHKLFVSVPNLKKKTFSIVVSPLSAYISGHKVLPVTADEK